MFEAFESVIYPFKAKDFFENYYRKKALYIDNQPEKFKKLFSWELFNKELNSSLVENVVSLPFEKYLYSYETFEFIKLCTKGKTFKTGLTELYSLNLKRFTDRLSRELNSMISVNLYCSAPHDRITPIHYDKYDLFIFQIEGTKKWQISTESEKLHQPSKTFETYQKTNWEKWDKHRKNEQVGIPGEKFPDNKTPYIDIIMKPGDFLYVPEGHWHKVIPEENPVLHLTVSMGPLYRGMDFFIWIYEQIKGQKLNSKIPFLKKDNFNNSNFDFPDRIKKEFKEVMNDNNLISEFVKSILLDKNPTEIFNFPEHYILNPINKYNKLNTLYGDGYGSPESSQQSVLKSEVFHENRNSSFTKNFYNYMLNIKINSIELISEGQEITFEKDLGYFLEIILKKKTFTIQEIVNKNYVNQDKALKIFNIMLRNNLIKEF